MPNKLLKNDNEIVISGFSGRYPECDNVAEFRDKLFANIDLINDEPRRMNMPIRFGKLKDHNLQNFDRKHFGIDKNVANCMDPRLRIGLETVYESIIDAGYNPQELRGTRVGVYFSVSNNKHCSVMNFSNQLSSLFEFRGPCYTINSNSFHAIIKAFEDIKSGECGAALVIGSDILLEENIQSYNQNDIQKLSLRNSDAEAVVAMFLQKSSDARRIYSYILNTRINSQKNSTELTKNQLLNEIYSEVHLNPNDVDYIEICSTPFNNCDAIEKSEVANFFCENRIDPLLIGSVCSNMGHPKSTVTLCSLSKILISLESGIIPPNLHQKAQLLNPNEVQNVNRNQSWKNGLVGINFFESGCINGHIILKSNFEKRSLIRKENYSKLVLISGRTENAVKALLNSVSFYSNNNEYIGLINKIYSKNIPSHEYRGYSLIDNIKDTTSHSINKITKSQPPIWLIYTGNGSQWPGMLSNMMRIDVFKQSILKSAATLKQFGIDLINIFTTMNTDYTDCINAAVTLTSIQLALTDVLKSVGIIPDGIIGHSVGEVAATYADDALTSEEAMLASYYGAYGLREYSAIKNGIMASVGLSWNECLKYLPKDVTLACNNGSDNVTISGPEKSVLQMINKLKSKKIFTKLIMTSGIPLHSEYMKACEPFLKSCMYKFTINPKKLSKRFISTSIRECDWDNPLAKYTSNDYFINNVLAPVYFYEGVQHIPENAICIEIAAHGLMQSILKRSLSTQINLSIMERNNRDNITFMLKNFGRLYCAGAQPQILNLYKTINYPVSHGTPMLNSSILWDHSEPVELPKIYNSDENNKNGNGTENV